MYQRLSEQTGKHKNFVNGVKSMQNLLLPKRCGEVMFLHLSVHSLDSRGGGATPCSGVWLWCLVPGPFLGGGGGEVCVNGLIQSP